MRAVFMDLVEINSHEFKWKPETEFCVLLQPHFAKMVQVQTGKHFDFTKVCVFLQVTRTARDREENSDCVQGSEYAFAPMEFCAG